MEFRKKRDCTIRVVKTKALISFAVTAKLICVLVVAYAKSQFSHDEAQIFSERKENGVLSGETALGDSDRVGLKPACPHHRDLYVSRLESYNTLQATNDKGAYLYLQDAQVFIRFVMSQPPPCKY